MNENENKEAIKITFDMKTGVMTYSGPREDGEELLKMVEDAGVEVLLEKPESLSVAVRDKDA